MSLRRAQVRSHDRLLDRGHGCAVPGLNRQQAGFRGRNGRHLVDRQQTAEVIDPDMIDEAGMGMSGPDRRELALDSLDGLLHALFAFT